MISSILNFQIGLMRSGRLLAEEAPQVLLSIYNCQSLEEVFLKLSRKQQGSGSNNQTEKIDNTPLVSTAIILDFPSRVFLLVFTRSVLRTGHVKLGQKRRTSLYHRPRRRHHWSKLSVKRSSIARTCERLLRCKKSSIILRTDRALIKTEVIFYSRSSPSDFDDANRKSSFFITDAGLTRYDLRSYELENLRAI